MRLEKNGKKIALVFNLDNYVGHLEPGVTGEILLRREEERKRNDCVPRPEENIKFPVV